MRSAEMGKKFTTQLNGQTVTVTVLEIEQNRNHRGYGKWVCRNEQTGRILHRTRRQLHPISEAFSQAVRNVTETIPEIREGVLGTDK